jgi:hypothetical protein
MNTDKTKDNAETYKTVRKGGCTHIRGAFMGAKRKMKKESPLSYKS